MSGIIRYRCKCIKSFGAADVAELFFLRRFPVNIHLLSPIPIHMSGGTATSAARALLPPVPSARNEAVCKARQHPTP